MIKIRKHLRKDIPHRLKWLNDPKVNKYLNRLMGEKTTLKKQKEWFSAYEKSKNKKFFTICDDSKPIGFMGLSNIIKENKNATVFIAIGDGEYRGKGVGRIAMNWLTDYGFKKLKLHKITLGVVEDNLPAVKLYKSLGFTVEGKIKDEIFYKNKYYNFILMAIFNKAK